MTDKRPDLYYTVISKDSFGTEYYTTIIAKTVVQLSPHWVITNNGTKISVQGNYITSITACTEDDYLYGGDNYNVPEPLRLNGEIYEYETNKNINATLELCENLLESINKDTYVKEKYIDSRYGFPITLYDVKMKKIQGQWVADINYKELDKKVLQSLCVKNTRLTTEELKFIRLKLEMGLDKFRQVFKLPSDYDESKINSWYDEKCLRFYLLNDFVWINMTKNQNHDNNNKIILSDEEFDRFMENWDNFEAPNKALLDAVDYAKKEGF